MNVGFYLWRFILEDIVLMQNQENNSKQWLQYRLYSLLFFLHLVKDWPLFKCTLAHTCKYSHTLKIHP